MKSQITEKEFNVLGHVCKVSEQRARYNYYRKDAMVRADRMKAEFERVYLEKNHSMDDVHSNGYAQGLAIIINSMEEVVDILVNNKIYDIDEKIFFDRHAKRYFNWDEVFDLIDDKYMEIIHACEDIEEYRARRKDSRGQFVGGGFGIGGAIKGSLQAGTLNMATGAAHGVFNFFGNIASGIKANNQKQALFENPNTLMILANGVWNNVFNLHYALYEIMWDMEDQEWDIVGREEAEKVEALLNNVSRIKDENDRNALLVECLTLDPYNIDIYEYVYENKLIAHPDLYELCDYFSINMLPILEESFKKKIQACEKKEKALNSCKVEIKKTMAIYHIDYLSCIQDVYDAIAQILLEENIEAEKTKKEVTIRACKKRLIKRIEQYQEEYSGFMSKYVEKWDKELRTYRGVVYGSESQRDQVVENDKEIERLYKNINNLDEDKIKKICNDLNGTGYSKECKDEYYYHFKNRGEQLVFDQIIDKNAESGLEGLVKSINEIRALKDCERSVKYRNLEKVVGMQYKLIGDDYKEVINNFKSAVKNDIDWNKVCLLGYGSLIDHVCREIMNCGIKMIDDEVFLLVADIYSCKMLVSTKRVLIGSREQLECRKLTEILCVELGDGVQKAQSIIVFETGQRNEGLKGYFPIKTERPVNVLTALGSFLCEVCRVTTEKENLVKLKENREQYKANIYGYNKEKLENDYLWMKKYEDREVWLKEIISLVYSQLSGIYSTAVASLLERIEEKNADELIILKAQIEAEYPISEILKKEYRVLQKELEKKADAQLEKMMPDDMDGITGQEFYTILREIEQKDYDPTIKQKYIYKLFDGYAKAENKRFSLLVSYMNSLESMGLVQKYFDFYPDSKRGEILAKSFEKKEEEIEGVIGTFCKGINIVVLFTNKLRCMMLNVRYNDIARVEVRKMLFGTYIWLVLKDGREEKLYIDIAIEDIYFVADILDKMICFINNGFKVQEVAEAKSVEDLPKEAESESDESYSQHALVNEGLQDCTQNQTGEQRLLHYRINDQIQSHNLNYPYEKFSVYECSKKFEKKLRNAANKYVSLSGDKPLVLYDTTLFESGKEGFVLSDKYFYYNIYGVHKGCRTIEQIDGFFVETKGKERMVAVRFIDGTVQGAIFTSSKEEEIEKCKVCLNNILTLLKENLCE